MVMPVSDPHDELSVQVPGRLIAIEILLVLLLRQKPDIVRIMREADAILQGIEADLHERSSSVHVLDVLSAARAAMDTLTEQAVRRN
jgi:hypothetical protein